MKGIIQFIIGVAVAHVNIVTVVRLVHVVVVFVIRFLLRVLFGFVSYLSHYYHSHGHCSATDCQTSYGNMWMRVVCLKVGALAKTTKKACDCMNGGR